MNIERLDKRLKEFTIDNIELKAQCDCKTELEQLLNSNKILFENGIYKYNEETKTGENYEIFSPLKNKHLKISIEDAKEYGCGTIQITASDMGVKLYTDFGFVHNGNFMQYKL